MTSPFWYPVSVAVTVNVVVRAGVLLQLRIVIVSELEPPNGRVNDSVLVPVFVNLVTGPFFGVELNGVMVTVMVPENQLAACSVSVVVFVSVRGVPLWNGWYIVKGLSVIEYGKATFVTTTSGFPSPFTSMP